VSLRLAMAVVAALVAVLLTCPVPVLDEESYLAIATGLDPLRPYDWWRPWPPWHGEREADAFVYAHPPGFIWWVWGWLKLVGGAPDAVGPLKVAAGLPWALLLGWSVGRLCERTTQRPWLAAAGWLTSPVVVLGLQRGLMPDLMLTALLTYAAVAWIEGMARPAGQGRTWWLGCGLALGLACLIKYPAVLLAPALLAHAWSRRRLRDTALTWVLPLVLVGGIELWLLVVYGRPHLWEVLSRAGEIPRGPFLGRAQGVMVRLCLAGAVVAVVGRRQGITWAVSVGMALGLSWLAMPAGTSLAMHAAVVALASAGVMGLFVAARAVAMGVPLGPDALPHRHNAISLLLGAWVLVWTAGVVVGHNFAGPRYLLPLSVPLALLVARFCELRVARRRWLGVVVVMQGLTALGLTWAERRFSVAAVDVAEAAMTRHPEGGSFTGEWALRWRLERAGWTFYTGDAPSGSVVLSPPHSSPGPLPSTWTLETTLRAGDDWPLRIVCASCGVGLYGETLGVMPFGWQRAPLEEIEVWRVP